MSDIFRLSDMQSKVSDAKRYHEFLRVPALSAGVYVLTAGAEDRQRPHNEDEIYYVVHGKAKMQLGSTRRAVGAGDVIFVEAGLEHRFFEIEQEVELLVVFAPAESQ